MWVFDATPLIYLATVDRLALVEHLDERCVIPRAVHAEVVDAGLERGDADARRVERAIEAGRFEVVTVVATPLAERLHENQHLSDADVAVLAHAAATDGVAVMDEGYGRDVAATEGLTTRGTAYLIVRLVRDGTLDAAAAQDTIDAMLDAGWYCAPDVYAAISRAIDRAAD